MPGVITSEIVDAFSYWKVFKSIRGCPYILKVTKVDSGTSESNKLLTSLERILDITKFFFSKHFIPS